MTTPALTTQKVLGAGAAEMYALQLLKALGSRLSEADQIWLSNNLLGLPDYIGSEEGGRVMTSVVACYRNAVSRRG